MLQFHQYQVQIFLPVVSPKSSARNNVAKVEHIITRVVEEVVLVAATDYYYVCPAS